MKHHLLFVAISGMVFLLSGCASAPVAPKSPGQTPDRLDFSDLQVGQTSRYVRFTAENYWDKSDTHRVYTPDTLEITVIDKEGSKFVIRESITPGSRAFGDTAYARSVGLSNAANTYINTISVKNDSLFFEKDTSRSGGTFLFLYATMAAFGVSDVLPLAVITVPEIQLYGWKTSYCECYRTGKVSQLNQIGMDYRDLNVVVDNVFMQVDGPGFTNVYSYQNGIVHSYSTNWWTGEGRGWDLL